MSSIFLVVDIIVALFQDPYDSFMRKHLQHYGYFTGKSVSLILLLEQITADCLYNSLK